MEKVASENFEALKQKSEEYLRLMIESAKDYAIFTLDLDRHVISWSKGAEMMMGYSEQEMIGQSGDIIFIREDRDKKAPEDEAERADKEGRAINERWHVRKDGTRFWGSGSVSPLRDSNGKLLGFVKIMRDRTASKEAEERKAFLLKLSDTLRPLLDAKKIQSEAIRVLREHLNAARVVYSEETGPGWLEIVASNSAEGISNNLGLRYRLSDFGAEIEAEFASGRTTCCNNILTDSRYSDVEKQAYAALNVIAWANAPLVKNGKLVAMLTIHFSNQHKWSPKELTLLEETAERIWAAAERVKVEMALRISERRFRTLSNAIPQIIWTNDAQGRANYFNERWYEYSGLTYDQSAGLGWQSTVHPDDANLLTKKWQEAFDEGKVLESEYRLRNASGQYRWFIGRNVPLKDDEESILAWFGSSTDIQALKEAEEALKSLADHLQLALDAGKLGSYEYDFKTGTYLCSRQHKFNFGYKEDEEVTLESLKERIEPSDQVYIETAFDKALNKDAVYSTEYRTRLPNGDVRWIRSVGRFVYDLNGQPKKMVGITRDVTEEKMFTEELSRQVKERTTELERSNNDLQQFAYIVSHDLKEPVRKIKTFNNRVREDFSETLPDKVLLYLNKINNTAERMYALIEGILNYSKLSRTMQSFRPVDLNRILQLIQVDLEVLIAKKNARFTISNLPIIAGEETSLYQLFYNLVLNSLKFSIPDRPPRISITCAFTKEDEKNLVKITLSDNGIGFEQEYADSIFDTFTRLNSQDDYEGTGLGLALCKKVVEKHGGSISATGIPEVGANFLIVLPVS